MTNPLIGLRLKALRVTRDINQDVIAELLGFRDRQTVSAIENGERRAKPEELATLIDHFGLDDDYFTDPFRLVGEGQFSWRQSGCAHQALETYRDRAGTWLALYRALSSADERPGPSERRSLRLSEHATFEAAAAEAERLTITYKMGEVPARELPRVMEDDFGILVLMVDMDDNMSGAACRLPELDAVLVNRKENAGRRNFDLAHEFFHILTWDTMPPKPVEEAREKSGGSRIEKLANSFASALLMPRRLIEKFGEWQHLGAAERVTRMRKVADYFQVSVAALHWRLVTLGLLARKTELPEGTTAVDTAVEPPPAFSRAFLTVVARGIEKGRVSASRATKLLGVPRELLRELLGTHGVPAPLTV